MLFAIGQMGGGDVKLLTALALWFTPASFLQLVVLMAVLGGGATLLIDPTRDLLSSLILAASAFTNSGVHIGRLPALQSWQTHLVIIPLALLGGLGLPVLMEMFDRITGTRRLSVHSKTVLVAAAVIYLGGLLLLTVLQSPASGDMNHWRHAVASASSRAPARRFA